MQKYDRPIRSLALSIYLTLNAMQILLRAKAKILIMILELGESLRHKEILALGLLLKWTND